MTSTQTFIVAGRFTINTEQVNFIEVSEEFGTVIHFAGGETLQLGEQAAMAFWDGWKMKFGSKSVTYL